METQQIKNNDIKIINIVHNIIRDEYYLLSDERFKLRDNCDNMRDNYDKQERLPIILSNIDYALAKILATIRVQEAILKSLSGE